MRLINAEVLKYWIKSGTKEGQKKVSLSKIMNIIECQDSVRHESVVYCKDCSLADESGYCHEFMFYPYTDDYCSRGVRKICPPHR